MTTDKQERCPWCKSVDTQRRHCPLRYPNGQHQDHDGDCFACTHPWHNCENPQHKDGSPACIGGIPQVKEKVLDG